MFPASTRHPFVALSLCLTMCACVGPSLAQSPPVFPISAVIEQVKREIAAAQNTTGSSLQLKLEKVEATLQVARTVDASGKVSIGVPWGTGTGEANAGGGRKAEESSTIYVELVPPKAGAALAASDAQDFGLTEAIVETRQQLLKGLNVEPRLDPRKVIITVKFSVTKSVAAGGQVKLVVLTLGGNASVAATDGSTIALTFSKAGL
jgi:hypothetical protein